MTGVRENGPSFTPGTREPEMHTAITTIEPSSIRLQVCFFTEYTG